MDCFRKDFISSKVTTQSHVSVEIETSNLLFVKIHIVPDRMVPLSSRRYETVTTRGVVKCRKEEGLGQRCSLFKKYSKQ